MDWRFTFGGGVVVFHFLSLLNGVDGEGCATRLDRLEGQNWPELRSFSSSLCLNYLPHFALRYKRNIVLHFIIASCMPVSTIVKLHLMIPVSSHMPSNDGATDEP